MQKKCNAGLLGIKYIEVRFAPRDDSMPLDWGDDAAS